MSDDMCAFFVDNDPEENLVGTFMDFYKEIPAGTHSIRVVKSYGIPGQQSETTYTRDVRCSGIAWVEVR
jgi:hypothetical protein